MHLVKQQRDRMHLIEAAFGEKSGHGWPFWCFKQFATCMGANTSGDAAITDDRINNAAAALLHARCPQGSCATTPARGAVRSTHFRVAATGASAAPRHRSMKRPR